MGLFFWVSVAWPAMVECRLRLSDRITPSAVVHPEHYVLFQGGEGVFGSGVPTTGQQQAVHLGIPGVFLCLSF